MTKKYNSQATIEAILSVATKLFLQKGFDKTSMQDIAKTAGISKGAIYHHFQSKDDIFKAVTEKQAQTVKDTMERWLTAADSLNGKETLESILEKNLDSQEAHCLDDVINVRMKSADFILSYMQDCVNNDASFISEIIKHGISDGSLHTEFPEECAEVLLLLLNVWCDPVIFNCDSRKLSSRLKFLQYMMKSLGMDILSDTFLEKTFDLLQKLYPEMDNTPESEDK